MTPQSPFNIRCLRATQIWVHYSSGKIDQAPASPGEVYCVRKSGYWGGGAVYWLDVPYENAAAFVYIHNFERVPEKRTNITIFHEILHNAAHYRPKVW